MNKIHFKYVIVETKGLESAILVPQNVSHDWAIDRSKAKLISAGFCTIEASTIRTEGYSTSLDLHSRAKDAAIIHETLMLAGWYDLPLGAITEIVPA